MKKIYLLPNLFTTGNFFCGIFAMTLTMRSDYFHAALLIVLAGVFDFLDGYIARLSKSTSKFGVEYDSLTDLLTFGIAPSFLIYKMALLDVGARWGLGITFLYAVCSALRLARFNAKLVPSEKKEFSGIPTTASAIFLAATILVALEYGYSKLLNGLPALEIILAALMVSNIPYPSADVIWSLSRKHPFFYLVGCVLSLAGIIFMSELFLFWVSLFYVVFGLYKAITPKIKKLWLEHFMSKNDLDVGEKRGP